MFDGDLYVLQSAGALAVSMVSSDTEVVGEVNVSLLAVCLLNLEYCHPIWIG